MTDGTSPLGNTASPSSRRAWIEITRDYAKNKKCPVALLAEGVDRNIVKRFVENLLKCVALLAEGVDRNICRVALCIDFFGRPPRGGRG